MALPSRNALILALVVAALGLAALGEQLRERLQRPRALTQIDVRGVHRIVLECRDCPRVTLQKITGRWQLSEPYSLPANPVKVESLLNFAVAPVKRRRDVAETDLAAAGLTPALATLAIGNARFEVGAFDPIRRMRYVRHGDVIAQVPDNYGDFTKLTAENLVDLHPLAPGGFDDATLDGRPLPPLARQRLLKLSALQVQPAPAGARGRALTLRLANGSEQRFQLCRYGDVWQLVLGDPAVSYVLAPDDAAALIAGTPEAAP